MKTEMNYLLQTVKEFILINLIIMEKEQIAALWSKVNELISEMGHENLVLESLSLQTKEEKNKMEVNEIRAAHCIWDPIREVWQC